MFPWRITTGNCKSLLPHSRPMSFSFTVWKMNFWYNLNRWHQFIFPGPWQVIEISIIKLTFGDFSPGDQESMLMQVQPSDSSSVQHQWRRDPSSRVRLRIPNGLLWPLEPCVGIRDVLRYSSVTLQKKTGYETTWQTTSEKQHRMPLNQNLSKMSTKADGT